MQKLFTIFFSSKHVCIDAMFTDQSFNNTLTNDIVSFEQLGQVHLVIFFMGFFYPNPSIK